MPRSPHEPPTVQLRRRQRAAQPGRPADGSVVGPLLQVDHLGRDTADKQRLYRTLADRLERAGVAGEDLFLSCMENGPDDWSFGFGRAQYVDGELPIPGRPPAST
jgi:hypothetical protein